jgi:DNA repair exonuclease SbcCD ATPase subunit
MAKQRQPSKEELELLERRNSQLGELVQVVETLTKKLNDLRQKKQKADLLQSVSLGLYDELDKLAKRAGADEVTDLALEQANDFIRDARMLMAEDPYVQRYKEFVPAGNNPQHRDVVVVMRQLRQGLERFDTNVTSLQTRWKESLEDAKGVRMAVELFLGDYEPVSKAELKEQEVAVKDRWLIGERYDDDETLFSFEVLDRTDIPTYFTAEQ